MKPFIRRSAYTGPIQGVILDWAGTAVDYGCQGPTAVFVNSFRDFGISVTPAEARQFMGLRKRDHIEAMCRLPAIQSQWLDKYNRTPEIIDIDAIYAHTEPMMVAALTEHADPIPGVCAVVAELRDRQIRIGSCTGYTRPMLAVLAPAAREKGYAPDVLICSSDVPAGRPYPWMCLANAIQLQIYPLEALVKIGDTVSDIEEGLNAGMWTIGITRTGNELGLTEAEVAALPAAELDRRLADISARFLAAGAHYTAASLADILPLVADINARLARGEHPLSQRVR